MSFIDLLSVVSHCNTADRILDVLNQKGQPSQIATNWLLNSFGYEGLYWPNKCHLSLVITFFIKKKHTVEVRFVHKRICSLPFICINLNCSYKCMLLTHPEVHCNSAPLHSAGVTEPSWLYPCRCDRLLLLAMQPLQQRGGWQLALLHWHYSHWKSQCATIRAGFARRDERSPGIP